jgi:hypothetical protein
VLQDSLQEDEGEDEDDEQRYLNLNEEEGDVWDDNSAYLEMLAKEVRVSALLHLSAWDVSELTLDECPVAGPTPA